MNIVANNVASKLFVAFVAVAMLFTLTTPAKAATAEELQQMINTLTAQIAALQGQVGQGGQSTASGVCPYTWTRSLKTGTTGADVMKLQQFLNADAETRVSASGVGSVGMETEYFGPATAAAVSKFQVKYRSDVLSPSGLVNPTGFFGPGSMAKANMICNSQTSTGDDSSDDSSDDSDDTSDDSDDTTSGDLSGEASLTTFEVADGDDSDDVEEGSEDVQIGELTVEFSDGDAMITRIDLALEADSANDGDDDAADVFEEVSLWVDGDEVARMDVTDEDVFLDEDDGSLRFSGLDIVGMEDEEVVIVVAVSVNSSVDNLDEEWELGAGSIRFVDADDVTTTDDSTGDLQDISSADMTTGIAEFTIETEGAGDSLDIETSTEDPDATTFSLDEDNNVEEAIFAFELSAEDSDGDVDLNTITLTATVTTASSVDDLVNDFRIEIDGESFDAESYTGTGMTATLVFDIDGDFTIAADAVSTVVLFADFEDMESGDEGSTIVAGIDYTTNVDAESATDITVGGTSKRGEAHTLRTEGLDLGDVTDGTGSSDSTQVVSGVATDANYGTMFLTYEITAFGDNLFIKADQASRGASTTAGVAYTIEDSSGAASTTGAVSVTYDIEGADENDGFFELEDGETYEMTVTVNSYNPVGTGGTYNLQVLSVGYAATAINATSSQPPTELEDYESDAVAIQS